MRVRRLTLLRSGPNTEPMRLPDFILANMEAIIANWEAFAATLFPARQQMTSLALRDHVVEIMQAVVADIRAPQTKEEQTAKSEGRAPRVLNAPETAAQTHALLRAKSGLDINQLASEYRALRASVLRLWEDAGDVGSHGFHDMIRLNEAIDQALAESIEFFAAKADESRHLLLGALGHDMRSPLQAILLTARSLSRCNANEDLSKAAECLVRSGASIQALLDDLVEFSRTKLGHGIPVELKDCDLQPLIAEEVEQQRTAHPGAVIEFTADGNVLGNCDGVRLRQVLRNLVTNAVAYGSQGAPVRVRLGADAAGIFLSVTNRGPAINPALQEHLFDPLKRGISEDGEDSREHLGIGLFIVREITTAHGGEVKVRSDAGETVFTVHLPRNTSAAGMVDPAADR
jgi:signal transduction histidine kinase